MKGRFPPAQDVAASFNRIEPLAALYPMVKMEKWRRKNHKAYRHERFTPRTGIKPRYFKLLFFYNFQVSGSTGIEY